MPANLSMVNGKAEMAYFGEKPWHGLGTVVEGLMTAAEALEKAGLDWTVVKMPLYIKANNQEVLVPNSYASVRTDSHTPLGVVGERYTPLQNTMAFHFMDSVIGTGEAKYETVGALGKGETVWLLARIPENVTVDGREEIERYLLLSNSHNGKTSLTVQWTPVRVVCQNTLAVAFRNHGRRFSAKHTLNLDGKMDTAQKMLGFANKYFEEFVVEAERLLNVRPTNEMLTKYFGELYNVEEDVVKQLLSDSKKPVGELERHVFNSYELYLHGAGNDVEPAKGTAWAVFNGIADYLDHAVSTRKGNTMENRFAKSQFGLNADVRQKAWELAQAMN
jgi:phage/plasmid-like protein (TIGR03299 family)